MRWSASRTRFASILFVFLAPVMVNAEVRLTVDAARYELGELVTIRIVNDTAETIALPTPCSLQLETPQGQLVWQTPNVPQVIVNVGAGHSHSFSWNQKDMGNGIEDSSSGVCGGDYFEASQVPAGCYQAVVGYMNEDFHGWRVVSTLFGIGETCYRFAVMADSRDSNYAYTDHQGANEVDFPRIVESIWSHRPQPAFVLFGGDLVTGTTGGPSVKSQLEEWMDLVAPHMSTGRIYPAFGGHERNRLAAGSYPYVWSAFTDLFDPVNNSAMEGPCEYFSPGNYGHTVYYCDHLNARFFVLNNDIANKSCDIATTSTIAATCNPFAHQWGQGLAANADGELDQVAWLEDNLGEKPLTFIIQHEPIFGIFRFLNPATRDGFVRALADSAGNATMVFTGHEHQYSRRLVHAGMTECAELFDATGNSLGLDPNCDFDLAFWEVKTGTCGAPIYDESIQYPDQGLRNVVVGPGFQFHYALVDVVGEQVEVHVYAIETPAGRTEIDRFTVPESAPAALPISPRMGTSAEMAEHDQWRLWSGANDVCRYYLGRGEPPSDWNTVGFDDSKWFVGPIGLGYGDGDDATRLFDMKDHYVTVYARCAFTVDGQKAMGGLTLELDYDDGFVAFINGIEIARDNVGSVNAPPHDQPASEDHEAKVYLGSSADRFDLSGNQLQAGKNILAIQVHNRIESSSDLTLLPWLHACVPSTASEVACSDGFDDDCDGTIDAMDSDCEPMLVQLDWFVAEPSAPGALLRWRTVSEIDTVGFHVLRGVAGHDPQRLTQSLIPARGSALVGAEYAYEDRSRAVGPVEYYLEDWDVRGNASRHGPFVLEGAVMRRRTR